MSECLQNLSVILMLFLYLFNVLQRQLVKRLPFCVNQQMHKIFNNTYLFISYNANFFRYLSRLLLTGSCLYAQLKAKWM